MSYQVLARKWRPKQFDQVVGQQHVLQPLHNALEQQRLHHAYLFTGTRGVGKTTIARILAKALNCEQGVSAQPCGQCQACLAIDNGRFVDLLEIDAASRTKVEDTRELLDNVQYRPTQGRYKVYLIDEVHMLSRHSFNALLKTLEEPPEHVKFLLATTDPQKLPVTILSRCLQFNLRAMEPAIIAGHLQQVLQQEQVPFADAALMSLARAARGSIRDALSLTDQAIAQGEGTVSEAAVEQMLGSIPVARLVPLLQAVEQQDSAAVFAQLDDMVALLPDVGALLDQLQSLLHRLAIFQAVPSSASASELDAAAQQLSQRLPAELLQVFYRIVIEGKRELPYANSARDAVEMTLLRLLSLVPHYDVVEPSQAPSTAIDDSEEQTVEDDLTAQQQKLMADAEQLCQAQPNEAEKPPAEPVLQPQPAPPEAPESEPEPDASGDDALSALLATRSSLTEKKNEKVVEVSEPLSTPQFQPPEPDPQANELESATLEDEPVATLAPSRSSQALPEITPAHKAASDIDRWSAIVESLEVSGLARQVLLHTEFVKHADNQFQINLAPQQQALLNDAIAEQITQALQQVFGDAAQFQWQIIEPQQPTPFVLQQEIDQTRLQHAAHVLESDPIVQALSQQFGAQLDQKSVKAR